MNFLIFFNVFILNLFLCSTTEAIASRQQQTCAWQNSTKLLIQQLTPQGQQTLNTIILDLQYITGAAIQPMFEKIAKKYAKQIVQITNTQADTNKIIQLGQLFGYGNLKCGAPPLIDACQKVKDIETLIISFTSTNQKIVNQIFDDFGSLFLEQFKSMVAVNTLLDASLYQQLGQTENKSVLVVLQKLLSY